MNIILGHQSLDFDALASMVAASKLYPDSIMVLEGKSSIFVQEFMALTKDQFPCSKMKDVDIDAVERVILVDTNELSRSVTHPQTLQKLKEKQLLVFDHHPFRGERGENIIVEEVGACTTLLVERLQRLKIKVTSMEATLMLLGIYDDTGSLVFENTTVRDAQAVAFLLGRGGQLSVVADYLRRPFTPEQMDVFNQLLRNGEVNRYNELPVYVSFAESPHYFGGLALLTHKLREIEDADVWFVVVKMANRINIVGRSQGGSLPVNEILQIFKGSGHEHAASANLKREDLPQVLEELKGEISKFVDAPSLVRDIMSYPVRTVYPDTPMGEVGKLLLKYAHSGMPVIENDRLVGVISRRDVDKALKYGLGHAPVKGFMSRDVVTAEPDMSWEVVQKLMVRYDIGRVPVVEGGQLVGLVSRSDILRLMYGSAVSANAKVVRERSLANWEDTLQLLRALPAYVRYVIDEASKAADSMQYPIFLVGGFVRDLLLGVPTHDFDFVVEGDSCKFAAKLQERLGANRVICYEEFGTARVHLKNGLHIDIAASRLEEYDFPGALPHVEQSSLKEDLFRRDFTINAMALCLNQEEYGRLIDYYGGSRDLQQKEIRFLHNMSFIDDPTRILRAIRFSCRYGFRLDKMTRDAIGVALETKVFAKISLERFTEELLLIYQEKKYQEMLKRLESFRVLEVWFAEKLPWHCAEDPEEAVRWPLAKRWLLSLKAMTLAQVERVAGKLKLNKALMKSTQDYLNVMAKMAGLSDREDVLALDDILINVPYFIRDIVKEQEIYRQGLEKYEPLRKRINDASRVSGADVMRMGLKEGPLIGVVLRQLRYLWLAGEVETEEDEKKALPELIQLTGLL